MVTRRGTEPGELARRLDSLSISNPLTKGWRQ